MNLKMVGTSSFFLLTSTVQPIIFATIAFYMFKSGGRPGRCCTPPSAPG